MSKRYEFQSQMSVSRFFRNVIAVIRGMLYTVYFNTIRHRTIDVGKMFRVYKGVSFRFDYNSNVNIGNSVRVDDNCVLFAKSDSEITISDYVGLGMNNIIMCHERIIIGSHTTIAPNVLIYDHDHTFDINAGVDFNNYESEEITIGKNCWIGANTVILKGSRIGDNCIIGAGSIIKGEIPSGSKVIQKRDNSLWR